MKLAENDRGRIDVELHRVFALRLVRQRIQRIDGHEGEPFIPTTDPVVEPRRPLTNIDEEWRLSRIERQILGQEFELCHLEEIGQAKSFQRLLIQHFLILILSKLLKDNGFLFLIEPSQQIWL